jgi:hypothetical protein
MLFCFILLSLCVFFVLQVFGRKEDIFGNLDLKSKKRRKWNLRKRSCAEEGDRTHQVRSNAPVREAHSSRSPVLEVLDSRVLANL